ncbi:MAG: mechanosensitive ion channel, partial [Acholeplasmatales bacterium]|nr:mechanosensitive ion channel [Acholeplasmatales bacterium]
MSFLNKLKNYALGSGVELAMAIIYVLVGYMIIRIIINLLKRSVNRSKIEKTIPNFIISILNIVLIIVLIVSVLKILGISTESVVTIASVISLGVSLALQDVIKGIANGFLLVTTKPFVEGEYVKIGDVEGTIISITMFNTVLKTTDGLMITYPNSQAI